MSLHTLPLHTYQGRCDRCDAWGLVHNCSSYFDFGDSPFDAVCLDGCRPLLWSVPPWRRRPFSPSTCQRYARERAALGAARLAQVRAAKAAAQLPQLPVAKATHRAAKVPTPGELDALAWVRARLPLDGRWFNRRGLNGWRSDHGDPRRVVLGCPGCGRRNSERKPWVCSWCLGRLRPQARPDRAAGLLCIPRGPAGGP